MSVLLFFVFPLENVQLLEMVDSLNKEAGLRVCVVVVHQEGDREHDQQESKAEQRAPDG